MTETMPDAQQLAAADRATIEAMTEWGPEGSEERRMREAAQLGTLTATSRQLDAAEALADALRASRDRQVIAHAQDGAPLAALARATGKSVQAVSKITRAAGINRYRPRSAARAAEAASAAM